MYYTFLKLINPKTFVSFAEAIDRLTIIYACVQLFIQNKKKVTEMWYTVI